MARPHTDVYTNLASATVTESAAGVLTFVELATGISLGQGTGMLIDQVDYDWSPGAIGNIVAVNDRVAAAWFTSNAPTGITLTDRRLIHMSQLFVEPVIGAAASGGRPFQTPVVHQFFPAIIIAAPRLYLAVLSNSLAAPAQVSSRLYFRYIDLTDKEYLELAETFILVG